MHKKSSNRSFGILFFLVFLGFGLWPLTKEMSPNSQENIQIVSDTVGDQEKSHWIFKPSEERSDMPYFVFELAQNVDRLAVMV